MANEREVTPKGRVSFPSVFTPNEFEGKSKYSLTLLFDADQDIKALKKLAQDAIEEKWGKAPKGLVTPFKDGNEKDLEKYPAYEDKICLTASSNFAPQLIDADRQPILDEEEFYGGCYGRMSVSAYAWEYGKVKKGVSFNLHNVQKLEDGERFGGPRIQAEDEFDDGVGERSSSASDEDYDL